MDNPAISFRQHAPPPYPARDKAVEHETHPIYHSADRKLGRNCDRPLLEVPPKNITDLRHQLMPPKKRHDPPRSQDISPNIAKLNAFALCTGVRDRWSKGRCGCEERQDWGNGNEQDSREQPRVPISIITKRVII